MITYIAVNGLGTLFESSSIAPHDDDDARPSVGSVPRMSPGIHGDADQIQRAMRGGGPSEVAKATGKAGFFLFLYLEVLDASFSFDGVIGAFAITADPIIIALGLGFIGAMFVRSITVYLVRKGTLGRVRLPRARGPLGHRRAGRDPAREHRLPRRRDRHRPGRGRLHRCRVLLVRAAEPSAVRGVRLVRPDRLAGRLVKGTTWQ